MRVVIGRQVRFVLVVAAVALLAELAVEGLQGLPSRGCGGLGEGLVAGRHCGRLLVFMEMCFTVYFFGCGRGVDMD